MNDQTENGNVNAEVFSRQIDMNAVTLSNAASTYAYNKINNLLLMQVLAKVENRDLEEIRDNVEKYIAEFSEEFIRKTKQG